MDKQKPIRPTVVKRVPLSGYVTPRLQQPKMSPPADAIGFYYVQEAGDWKVKNDSE